MLEALRDNGAPAGPMPTYMPPVAAPHSPGTYGGRTIQDAPPAGPMPTPPVAPGTYGGATIQDAPPVSQPTLAQGYYADHGLPVPGATTSAPASSPFDSDPGYQAALAQEKLGIGSINNNLNNLIAQRIVQYGDPSLASMAGFGLDPQSAAFAQQNYLSGNGQLARLDKAHTQARKAVVDTLAGHGLIFSGDTGYQLGNADQSYGNQVYDAQQQALADILGYRNSAQSQETDLHNAVISALENAFNNYSANPGAYGQIPNTPASPKTQTNIPAPKLPGLPKPKAARKNPAANALAVRSQALNKLYGL